MGGIAQGRGSSGIYSENIHSSQELSRIALSRATEALSRIKSVEDTLHRLRRLLETVHELDPNIIERADRRLLVMDRMGEIR